MTGQNDFELLDCELTLGFSRAGKILLQAPSDSKDQCKGMEINNCISKIKWNDKQAMYDWKTYVLLPEDEKLETKFLERGENEFRRENT